MQITYVITYYVFLFCIHWTIEQSTEYFLQLLMTIFDYHILFSISVAFFLFCNRSKTMVQLCAWKNTIIYHLFQTENLLWNSWIDHTLRNRVFRSLYHQFKFTLSYFFTLSYKQIEQMIPETKPSH